MGYNPLVGLPVGDREFVAKAIDKYWLLGVYKSPCATNQAGYRYVCYVRVAARDRGYMDRLQNILGGNIQKTAGKQHVWQMPQKHIILLLNDIKELLSPGQRKRAEIIINLRELSMVYARTPRGIPQTVWDVLNQYYAQMDELPSV